MVVPIITVAGILFLSVYGWQAARRAWQPAAAGWPAARMTRRSAAGG